MIYLVITISIGLCLAVSYTAYRIGYQKGKATGYKEGYEKAYQDVREDKELKYLDGVANILNYTGEVKKNG